MPQDATGATSMTIDPSGPGTVGALDGGELALPDLRRGRQLVTDMAGSL